MYLDWSSSPVLFSYYKVCFLENRAASVVDTEKCYMAKVGVSVQNCIISSEIGNPIAAPYLGSWNC